MVELRWIKAFLFLILGLQFTAVTGQTLYITVRDRDEATLSCKNVMTDQDKCNSTSWIFSGSTKTETVQLVELGQISESAKAESNRLNVTADCSLVIKKVTVEDVGLYLCQQYDRSGQFVQDSPVFLSVVSMTEHKDTDKVKLSCSVSIYGRCEHTVKLVYEGNDQEVNTRHMKEPQSSCSSTVEFTTSYLTEMSKYSGSFKCNVTDKIRKVQQFTFIPPSSGEDTKRAATTTSTPNMKSTTMGKSTLEQDFPDWAKFTIVAVGIASLLIIVLVLIRFKKTKRNKTQMDENIADPEDGVSYAYVTFAKKNNCKARVRGVDAAVIYSTLKASSSSAGASTDPGNLYATVNRLKK